MAAGRFELDRTVIKGHPRLKLLESDLLPIDEYFDDIEKYINICFASEGWNVVQHGRVIALRATDQYRLSSAFKAGIYLGKYNDLGNTRRFLTKMVEAGHSYEPIRGENVLFLFIGIAKPVYDHMVTYSVGRPTRIAGGQRANVPWGFEVPVEARDYTQYEEEIERIREVVRLTKTDKTEQMQAARSKLPVGYIMPPFLMEFTEEALIRTVFRQRLFEKGAQGATVEIVASMLKALMEIDPEKWNALIDHHGPHIEQWKKAMRTIRDKEYTIADLLADAGLYNKAVCYDKADLFELFFKAFHSKNFYDILMKTVGKLPPSMWDKMK